MCECHGYKRDREPSRIPVKMFKRLSQTSRKLRCYVRSCLSKNVLKVQHLIKNIATQKKSTHKTSIRFAQKMRRKPIFSGTRIVNSSMRYNNDASRDTHGKKYHKYLRFFSCNFPYSEYKSVIHRGNCTKYKLHNDIEKNPDPVMHHVDPSKTIQVPYSQGDVAVFEQNAGQRVTMSLCALVYHNMKGIGNPDDLKQIMHIGNRLYSSLSILSRQSFLLLTDLPSMLTEEDYQLTHSEIYTGNIHGALTNEGYKFCMGLKRAFEALISELHGSFILRVGCIAVV